MELAVAVCKVQTLRATPIIGHCQEPAPGILTGAHLNSQHTGHWDQNLPVQTSRCPNVQGELIELDPE